MKTNRLLCLILAALLMLIPSSAAAYEPSDWAKEEVAGAMHLGLLSEAYDQIAYQDSISRLDFVRMAMNLYATITREAVSTHGTNPFNDTLDPFANMAYYTGIVSGDGSGGFHPGNTLTRQELCKIVTGLLNSAGVLGAYFPSQYTFRSISDEESIAAWAKNHVAFMLDNNLMAGDDQGRFRPADSVTRQEAAIVAYRCYNRYGSALSGEVKTVLYPTADKNGAAVLTLLKGLKLSDGTIFPLTDPISVAGWSEELFQDQPEPTPAVASVYEVSQSTTAAVSGYAPSGTKLQVPDANGLFPVKTYSETIASGEAQEKMNRIFPNGVLFTSAQEADAQMCQVTVPVWKLDGENNPVSSTLTFRIHQALKDDVIAIFHEIYNAPVKAPLKDVNAYAWRSPMSSGKYSDHNYGVAIDLNYNENYCIYANGSHVGSFYNPQNSPYSFPKDGVVVQTFAKYGWLWGGNAWKNGTVDYMHFSYLGR